MKEINLQPIKYLIEHFVILQSSLLKEFFTLNPNLDDKNFLIGFPRRGAIYYSGNEWSFKRHGLGLSFTNKYGIVIDAHKWIEDFDSFDAYRLSQYFESLGFLRPELITESDLYEILVLLKKSGFLTNTNTNQTFQLSE